MSIQKTLFITLAIFGSIVLLIAVAGIYRFNFTNDDLYIACTEEAKICPDGSAVGRTGPNCEFTACPAVTGLEPEPVPVTGEKFCKDGQRNLACIEIYQPVCATVNIQCIKAPCYPIKQTFSSSCHACANNLVTSYTEGACTNETKY